jgi:hypothetical protein
MIPGVKPPQAASAEVLAPKPAVVGRIPGVKPPQALNARVVKAKPAAKKAKAAPVTKKPKAAAKTAPAQEKGQGRCQAGREAGKKSREARESEKGYRQVREEAVKAQPGILQT